MWIGLVEAIAGLENIMVWIYIYACGNLHAQWGLYCTVFLFVYFFVLFFRDHYYIYFNKSTYFLSADTWVCTYSFNKLFVVGNAETTRNDRKTANTCGQHLQLESNILVKDESPIYVLVYFGHFCSYHFRTGHQMKSSF